jgi:hypothetical protein
MVVSDPAPYETVQPPHQPLPGLGTAQAVRRHWPLVVAPVVIMVAAAAAFGLSYRPTYTAEARLNVGRLDVTTQSIPGYANGIQSLAVAFARAVTADAVVRPVATKLRLTPQQVSDRLDASPVPQSPLIIVDAKGPTEGKAVDLANAASDQLVAYLTTVDAVNPGAARLLSLYKAHARRLNDLKLARPAAQRAFRSHPTAANRRALSASLAEVQQQALLVSGLKTGYLNLQQGANSASLVQVLNPAQDASSNKRTRLAALLFGALVIGLLVGVTLAVARSRAALRRTLLYR